MAWSIFVDTGNSSGSITDMSNANCWCNSDEACGHEEESMPIRAVDHYPRTPIPESSFEIVDGVVTELDCRAPRAA